MRELSALSPLLLPWLLLLGSCGSPPRAPAVDESRKRPVNNALAVELQVCTNELANTRIAATESGRTAESSAAALQRLVAGQRAMAALQTQTTVPRPNSVFTIHFRFGSTHVSIPAEMLAAMTGEARQAPLIVLRGRTDGANDSPAESRVARERAAAVRAYLVAAGVDPARIRATHQASGDHVADNTAVSGRAMNRRVEVEMYRMAPVSVGVAEASSAAPSPNLP